MKQRLITVVLLITCGILGVIGFFLYVRQDRHPPKISVRKMNITYREGDGYDALLKGIEAEDKRDGNLSSQVFVDRIIPTENGKAVIRYGVIDKSKNVGTATRIVTYIVDKQIEPEGSKSETKESDQSAEKNVPAITLSTERVFISAGSEFDPLSVVANVSGSTDDTNVLLQQITVEGDYDIYTPNDYQLDYCVTDSHGNTSEVRTLILTVE